MLQKRLVTQVNSKNMGKSINEIACLLKNAPQPAQNRLFGINASEGSSHTASFGPIFTIILLPKKKEEKFNEIILRAVTVQTG